MQAYIHTHTHAYTHSHIQAYIHTGPRTPLHIHSHLWFSPSHSENECLHSMQVIHPSDPQNREQCRSASHAVSLTLLLPCPQFPPLSLRGVWCRDNIHPLPSIPLQQLLSGPTDWTSVSSGSLLHLLHLFLWWGCLPLARVSQLNGLLHILVALQFCAFLLPRTVSWRAEGKYLLLDP